MDQNISPNDYKYNVENQSIIDKRSRKWTYVKLNQFFDPLIQKRIDIKKEIKNLSSKQCSEQEIQHIEELKALEAIIKLISNTVYGIIASPYFNIGNTILANNITAKARNSIWLYSRCLNGFQTITDGFQYQPERVITFKSTRKDFHKPSLKVLSDLKLLEAYRYTQISSLQQINWNNIILSKDNKNKDLQQIDKYAKEHIKSFLAYYGLEMDYEVEHKLEHTASKLFYIKKAHYVLQKFDTDKIIYKVRGTSEKENPIYLQLANKYFKSQQNDDDYDNDLQLESLTSRITTIFDYKTSKKKALKSSIKGDFTCQIQLPGRNIFEKKIFRLNSLDLPYRNEKEFKQRHSVKNNTDYGPLLKSKPFEEVFQQRNSDYLKLQ